RERQPLTLERDAPRRADTDQRRIGRKLDRMEDRTVRDLVLAGIGEAFALVGAHDGGAHLTGWRVEDAAQRVGPHREFFPAILVDERPALEPPATQQLRHSNSTSSAPSGTCSPTA